MIKSKVRVLVLVNPNASRAEAALPKLFSWFTENCRTFIIVAKSKKERKEGVRHAWEGGRLNRDWGR
jgi:hypothetical protein